MANYSFLDAASSVQTAMSSTIGGVQVPIVKISDTVSVISAISSGSIQTVQSGTVVASVSGNVTVNSVVGTYGTGGAHGNSDSGLFMFGVRNDTLSSVVSADVTYGPLSIGPSGEVIASNAPLTKWVQGTASLLTNGVLQPIIGAQGSSIFTYITAVQAVNASTNNLYLTFYGATSSVVGYLPIPANSGALPIMPNGWKTNANGAFSASVNGVGSVYLSASGFISKT